MRPRPSGTQCRKLAPAALRRGGAGLFHTNEILFETNIACESFWGAKGYVASRDSFGG